MRKSGVAPSESVPGAQRPETYRLPKPGSGDPFWGFSRSFYYRGEELGYWRLIRIAAPGKSRGVTLIPYAEIEKFVRSQIASAK
jgi:hypothetical protein